jgi:hypothetical protein
MKFNIYNNINGSVLLYVMSNCLDLVLINKNREILSKMDEEGIKLVDKNDFFNDLSEVMSDEKVTRFFDKYFKNFEEIKSTVIYMKLFRLFQQRYKDVSQEELSKYVNIYLLHKVMTEKDVRRTLITATMDHLKNNKLPILNLTPDILKKRKKEIKLKKKIEKWQKKQDKDA